MSKLALSFPEIKEKIPEIDAGLSDAKRGSFSFSANTPAEIVTDLMPYIFTIAGIILFIMIIAGGFSIFTSAGNAEKVKKGQGMLVNALIGFLIIFAAYWIIQLVEFSLGLDLI